MSQSRKADEDDMAISYVPRPTGHSQQLPSFRELLPPHLHDEIDSSTYYNSRPPSQDRPSSGHDVADPRSMPGFSPTSKTPYRDHREYTTRASEPRRALSDHVIRTDASAPGPSPILPPIRDLQSMPEYQGYADSRMAPRSDPYAHDYRSAPPAIPGPVTDRRPEAYGHPIMHAQAPYGHPGMPYGDAEHAPPQMMGHPQANFGIMGDPNDPKGKRRRGNLPKPVTDILRSWFHEHLDHPYPSEEDKQMFMTRTGLSISQVREFNGSLWCR
ncbi:hypothetical protein N7470_000469 [Penicillium chermesinum]|nr:hypothetical protein N7470_000469 [Penicillium chermesinum]